MKKLQEIGEQIDAYNSAVSSWSPHRNPDVLYAMIKEKFGTISEFERAAGMYPAQVCKNIHSSRAIEGMIELVEMTEPIKAVYPKITPEERKFVNVFLKRNNISLIDLCIDNEIRFYRSMMRNKVHTARTLAILKAVGYVAEENPKFPQIGELSDIQEKVIDLFLFQPTGRGILNSSYIAENAETGISIYDIEKLLSQMVLKGFLETVGNHLYRVQL